MRSAATQGKDGKAARQKRMEEAVSNADGRHAVTGL
jgi:hypothetical protein